MFLFRAKKYIQYRRRAVNQYGLHSPFLFELYNQCFKPRFTHSFPEILKIRKALKEDKSLIEVADFGAGSQVQNSVKRKVSEMYGSASISKKQGELFQRLTDYFKPEVILELGTHLGVSGLYFLENTDSKLVTIEACENTQTRAKQTLEHHSNRIEFKLGTFKERLPEVLEILPSVDIAYIDGNHDYENTIWHFNMLLKKVNANSVLIFDDINWSKEMAAAWEEIIKHEQVSISVNCYKFGLLFFREGIEKQEFCLKF